MQIRSSWSSTDGSLSSNAFEIAYEYHIIVSASISSKVEDGGVFDDAEEGQHRY